MHCSTITLKTNFRVAVFTAKVNTVSTRHPPPLRRGEGRREREARRRKNKREKGRDSAT